MTLLYEQFATAVLPLHLEQCACVVFQSGIPPRQCSRKVREVIDGHGYCHPHAKLVRP